MVTIRLIICSTVLAQLSFYVWAAGDKHHAVPTYLWRRHKDGSLVDRTSSEFTELEGTPTINEIPINEAGYVQLKVWPDTIKNGGLVTVSWSNLTNRQPKDYIALYCPYYDHYGHYLDWFYINSVPGHHNGTGHVQHHIYNMRSACAFKLYRQVWKTKKDYEYQLAAASNVIRFADGGSLAPLHGHIALTNDPAEMRVMWVSGKGEKCIKSSEGTGKGACCVFPFKYKGKTYNSCTREDHNQLWCSTTSDYDKDKRWGNCASKCIKSSDGTGKGSCCVFPFKYRGKTYDSCTKEGHNQLWCSTTSDYDKDKRWGNCASKCLKSSDGNGYGACCVFPFKYRGKTYNSCTKEGHNQPWCATTTDYDKDKRWGNCGEKCVRSSDGNEHGACCVFPFKYRGKTYDSCTTEKHNQLWCATTSDYDKDKRWGNCASKCLKSSDGNGYGACCVFPFKYRGETYNSCTKKDHNQLWCSTTIDYDKNERWGNCASKCLKSSEGTAKGACCVFPFKYRGKTYDSCTKEGHNQLWCATTSDYDKDKKWGNCGEKCHKSSEGNGNRACCVFPFKYKGKTYDTCTKEDHNQLWCATTNDYDKDKRWGNCASKCIKSSDSGACCVFPFKYRGKVYDSCTNEKHNQLWCATTSDYDKDKRWGNCEAKKCFRSSGGNGKGACCVFPFRYRGKTYDSCTKEDHNQLWCSTTSDYDKDKRWGNCGEGCLKSSEGTAKGDCCVFPFKYRGKTYDSCTKEDHNQLWCSTTSDYDKDKRWGNCGDSDCVKTSEGTGKGACCVFPFKYRGKTYDTCTREDHNQLWCSTTSDYDKDKRWGNCVEQPIVRYGPTKDMALQEYRYTTRTYTADSMCQSPANAHGFWNPGIIHDVLLTNLKPNTMYYYMYGRGRHMSEIRNFTTALPKGDTTPFTFVVYGDMGVLPPPLSYSTATNVRKEIDTHKTKYVFHIGDISYARGWAYIWEHWAWLVEPYATLIPYMIGVGNHEYEHTAGGLGRDPSGIKTDSGWHPKWFNGYTDSGGECGVPLHNRFHMPDNGNSLFWYSYDYGMVHMIMISTEHDYSPGSAQYVWLENDLKHVNRSTTPWVVIGGHRPMYNSQKFWSDYVVATHMQDLFEDLLYKYKVDLAFWAHYHSYERTCKLYKNKCVKDGIIHITIGNAGFDINLDGWYPKDWSLVRITKAGYGRVSVANSSSLLFEVMINEEGKVMDHVWLHK